LTKQELASPEHGTATTIIDATNPIADAPPQGGVLLYTTGPNESLGEKIHVKGPQSHVVKAFNSVGNAQMVNPHYEQGTPTMFLCGDNDAAKSQVSEIIKQFGWEPFDWWNYRRPRPGASLAALAPSRLPPRPVESRF